MVATHQPSACKTCANEGVTKRWRPTPTCPPDVWLARYAAREEPSFRRGLNWPFPDIADADPRTVEHGSWPQHRFCPLPTDRETPHTGYNGIDPPHDRGPVRPSRCAVSCLWSRPPARGLHAAVGVRPSTPLRPLPTDALKPPLPGHPKGVSSNFPYPGVQTASPVAEAVRRKRTW